MREQDHAKIVLPGLQAHGGDVVNAFFGQHLAELQEAAAGESRQGLGHFGHIAKGHKSAPPVGQFAHVLSRSALLQLAQELRGKTALHRRQDGAPALRDADDGPARGQGRNQPVQYALHAGDQIIG